MTHFSHLRFVNYEMSDLILIISKSHFGRKAYDAENASLICNINKLQKTTG